MRYKILDKGHFYDGAVEETLTDKQVYKTMNDKEYTKTRMEQQEKRIAELIRERDQYYKNKCAANERTEHYRVIWMEKKEEFEQYKIDLRSSKEICPRAFRRVGHFRTVPFE